MLALVVAACDSETVGERIPTELDGVWDGTGVDQETAQIRISLRFNLEENDGRVTGAGTVGNVGRGSDPLSIEGTYEGVDLELVITDSASGESVTFDGWASADEIRGDLYGAPLIGEYDATLRRLSEP